MTLVFLHHFGEHDDFKSKDRKSSIFLHSLFSLFISPSLWVSHVELLGEHYQAKNYGLDLSAGKTLWSLLWSFWYNTSAWQTCGPTEGDL